MWNDVVIGKGEKGCSAMKVFAIPGEHSISQNSVSFWISGCLLGAGVTIFKNTADGKALQALIEAGTALDEIQEWLDCLVLRNLDPKKLRQLIERSNEEAFLEGKRAKAAEIRAALEF